VADVRRERQFRPDAELALCEDPARVARDVLFDARLVAQERCDLWNPAASRLPFLLLADLEQVRALSSVPGIREVDQYDCVPAASMTLGHLLAGLTVERFVLLANYRTDDPMAEVKRRKDRKRALRLEAAAAEP
jgi:hypothetical protein